MYSNTMYHPLSVGSADNDFNYIINCRFLAIIILNLSIQYDIISITKSGLNAITDHYKMATFLLQLNEIQMVVGVPNQI